MIIYDGVSLESVADVKIEDVRVNPIVYEDVASPRAIRGGSDFVRSRAGTRTVIITFAVLEADEYTRQRTLMAISEWAKNDKEYRLEVPGHPEHYLVGKCTEKPDPSLRQWWESRLRLVFTCYDNPYWNSKGEKSVACGTAFHVLGDAPPLMRIERTLASTETSQSYGLDGKTITFSTIPAGDMVIDLDRQTAVVGSTDIMQYYLFDSRFLIPHTGDMTVTGTGTVKYRERWQ